MNMKSQEVEIFIKVHMAEHLFYLLMFSLIISLVELRGFR